jgi:hypothetical protein
MKTTAMLAIAAAFLGLNAGAWAGVDVDVHLVAPGPGPAPLAAGFDADLGDYYHVPQDSIDVARRRHIPDEELPVVFFLARQGHVPPDLIIRRRLAGRSWMDITRSLHLSPGIFYMPMNPPHESAYWGPYGLFLRTPREHWGRIRLADPDIVNFVNLRFASEHYGYRPEEVISMRAQGRHFNEMRRDDARRHDDRDARRDDHPGAMQGPSHHDHDHDDDRHDDHHDDHHHDGDDHFDH